MPTPSVSPSRRLHRYAVGIIVFAALLVWWGAAVTTKDVGLAVPDWPLAYNRINPEGWWKVMALMLEHGHRWLATLLSGLVLILLAWTAAVSPRRPSLLRLGWLELGGVVLGSVALVALVAFNRSPAFQQHSPAVASLSGWGAILLGVLCVAWLGWSLAKRRWPLPLKLAALCWVVVGLQAILGGLRVTEMSDLLGVVHGCLGQALFCLLVWVALATSPRWPEPAWLTTGEARAARGWSLALLLVILVQLTLGATVRHTQRSLPAALDVLTTGGSFWPGVERGDLLLLFSHKFWGVVVFLFALATAWQFHRRVAAHRSLKKLAWSLPALIAGQITFGVLVLLTMDRYKVDPHTEVAPGLHLSPVFWVTNFHVIVGLTILACAFALVVKSFAATPHHGLLARPAAAPSSPEERPSAGPITSQPT